MKRVALGAALMMVLVGCADSRVVQTFTMEPGQSPGGGLVDGELQGNEECVVLVRPGEPPIALLWEERFKVTAPPLRLHDDSGKVVAAAGQHVWLGVQPGKTTANPACGTSTAFWVFSLSTTDPITDTP